MASPDTPTSSVPHVGPAHAPPPRTLTCPHGHAPLADALTRKGIALHRCPTCGGTWLEKGEVFVAADSPSDVMALFEAAEPTRAPSDLASPDTGAAMNRLTLTDAITAYECPASGGLWFEGEDWRQIVEIAPALTTEATARPASTAAGTVLAALPNLALRAVVAIGGLYALLVGVLLLVAPFIGVDWQWVVGGAAVVIVLQFIFGPWIMDLTVRWLYSARWVPRDELPAHLSAFIARVCGEHDMPFPSVAIIDDGAPQAFTYGHTPSNARIVISKGLLDILDEPESEAVVAHEIGHAVHWDMLVMTAVQMIPLITYSLFRALMNSKSNSDDSKSKGAATWIAVAAYVVYIVSVYITLWLSRIREYHADRFAGRVTGDPAHLASALVKIGYGLAGYDPARETEGGGSSTAEPRSSRLYGIGALGIFNRASAKSLAISGYSGRAGEVDKAQVRAAMRWDLWNPWARWFQLNSTHPLIAYRLTALANQSAAMGQEPYVTFDETKPANYWGDFAREAAIQFLPLAALIAAPLAVVLASGTTVSGMLIAGAALAAFGAAYTLKLRFTYRSRYFPEMSIAALLNFIRVSEVRPVPCTLRGIIIGRGVPGLIISNDFVMQDRSGIIFLDYRQPLAILEWLFGLLRSKEYAGREVVVTGWYRRNSAPFVELSTITMDGKTRRSWVPPLKRIFAAACLVGGLALIGLGEAGIDPIPPVTIDASSNAPR